jgi:hypothetical protein
MEARSRGSASSHSRATQSFTARAKAAARSSLNSSCTPYRQLQIANRVPNGSSTCSAMRAAVAGARPAESRQSARTVSGALVG